MTWLITLDRILNMLSFKPHLKDTRVTSTVTAEHRVGGEGGGLGTRGEMPTYFGRLGGKGTSSSVIPVIYI